MTLTSTREQGVYWYSTSLNSVKEQVDRTQDPKFDSKSGVLGIFSVGQNPLYKPNKSVRPIFEQLVTSANFYTYTLVLHTLQKLDVCVFVC